MTARKTSERRVSPFKYTNLENPHDQSQPHCINWKLECKFGVIYFGDWSIISKFHVLINMAKAEYAVVAMFLTLATVNKCITSTSIYIYWKVYYCSTPSATPEI